MRSAPAQIHLVEIALGVLVFVVAIVFVASLPPVPHSPSYSELQLRVLGADTLRSFDLKPINVSNASIYHNSSLTYELFGPGKWAETGDITNLTYFLNSTLSKNISYNLYLRNSTTQIELYFYSTPGLNSVSAHRTIVYDGIVYEVELLLWYEPR